MPLLYSLPPSPPSRACRLVARALGVELELKDVNIMEGENRTPEFLEMNPLHTIPVLDDDGFVLCESRAIMCYLVDKYGSEDDVLLPKDAQARGKILERVLFDATLNQRLSDYYSPVIYGGAEYDESKLAPLEEVVGALDKFLDGNDWVAGENLTIADITLTVTVAQLEILGFDLEKYPNVTRWLESTKGAIDGYDDINQQGVNIYKKLIDEAAAARGQ